MHAYALSISRKERIPPRAPLALPINILLWRENRIHVPSQRSPVRHQFLHKGQSLKTNNSTSSREIFQNSGICLTEKRTALRSGFMCGLHQHKLNFTSWIARARYLSHASSFLWLALQDASLVLRPTIAVSKRTHASPI